MRGSLIGAVVIATTACGSTHGPGTTGDIPVGELVTEVSKVYCDLLVACGVIDDVATCQTINLDVSLSPDLIAAIAAGTVLFHADKARACVTGIAAWTCDRTVVFTARSQPAACDEMFEGTVADMGTCELDQECVSQRCSVPACSMACCPGTCVGGAPPVRPQVGEACTATSHCVDSFCDSASQTCTAYLAEGATCLSSSQCATGATCNGNTCQMLVAIGGACTTTSQCLDIGATCSQSSMTCVAVGLTGGACTTSNDCSTLYTCQQGVRCALKPRLGEACTTSCVDHSFCDATSHMCTAPLADGAACTSNKQCSSNHCDGVTLQCATPATCI